MRKLIAIIASLLLCAAAFAQTSVAEKKLGKTLEKNKDASAVFVSEIDLRQMTVAEDGRITIPLLAKNKIVIVSEMDMTSIAERIAASKKSKLTATFTTKDAGTKTYALTDIAGLESAGEYNARIAKEERDRWKQERTGNLTKVPVQVVNQEVINIAGTEASWLPGQVQDKLKSNLQEYMGMRTVVDAKSETALKKLQAESESASRDEASAIELGKITTAKFALFVKVRKTGTGYTLAADFTDLTTGEQLASVSSKEYTKAEYLYGTTGAADEITLLLAGKLGIGISELNKNLLANGSASFTVDEQLALAKQNEEQYKKMMAQYDSELAKLSVSNDLSAVENKRKIEAEKALLAEKQSAEQKRQTELAAQKEREAADAKLEAERSIALRTQRDQMAKDAAAKAEEVRKLKMESQGVLGQINVLESKKKALVEIRQGVENRATELYNQMVKDRDDEEKQIRNKAFSAVELENGMPTQAANRRRENQVFASYEKFVQKFLDDAAAVQKVTSAQDAALLAEIRADQKSLAKTRTVSSMGDELKVSYGTYSGQNNGWNAYLSLYSDGVLLYQDTFIVSYEAAVGKKSPNLETETNDAVVEEYMANVDMYNSLLTRGDPIIYFEIDYSVRAEDDNKPSGYEFTFDKIRVINTLSGKTMQTSTLSKKLARTMTPVQDLREIHGAVAKAKAEHEQEKFINDETKKLQAQGRSDEEISKVIVILPSDTTSIKDEAFKDNKIVNYVIIPNSVTHIGDSAFEGCSALKSITIPNSVTHIGDSAFKRCNSLTSVMIPNSVTHIGDSAFEECRTLTSVTISGPVGNSAFAGCISLKNVTLLNSVTSIGKGTFSDCKSLTSITIPNSVIRIGDSAFFGCVSLTSITIPSSVTFIESYTFHFCRVLTSVTIPNSVTHIGNSAFKSCYSLASVTIPKSVASIEKTAFEYCDSLKIFNYTGTEAEWQGIKINYYGNDALRRAKINYNYKGE